MKETPASTLRSAYVHIPFCARVCPYCDFAVVAGEDELTDRYLAALLAEIGQTPSIGSLDAVYVGGGTPSRFGEARLAAVLETLRINYGFNTDVEVSLEANPEDGTLSWAEALMRAGFTRVSFGAQSFDQMVLTYLGRVHTPEDIAAALAVVRKAGFSSINLDLIFGSPVESLDSWRQTLTTALTLRPEHVSTYALTVEKGTELSRQVSLGAPAPDVDDQADKWELAAELLGADGFERYEISNYARPDHRCRYNLSVWDQGEYLGFGNGAHRHVEGVRSNNPRRLHAYLEAVESGRLPKRSGASDTAWEREVERVFLGLRRTSGVVAGLAGRTLLESAGGVRLLEAGVIATKDGRIIVTKPLLTDEVSRLLLSLSAVDC